MLGLVKGRTHLAPHPATTIPISLNPIPNLMNGIDNGIGCGGDCGEDLVWDCVLMKGLVIVLDGGVEIDQ